jgi:uncharacterized membrane protein
MAMASRLIIIALLLSILGVLTVTLVVPMIAQQRAVAKDDASISAFIKEGESHGY